MQMRWFWILWLHAFWVKQMEMMMAGRQVQQGFAINIISWLTWLLQCEANNMVPTIASRHIFLFLDCIVTDKCKLMCMNDEGFHSFLFGTRCRRRRLSFNVAIFFMLLLPTPPLLLLLLSSFFTPYSHWNVLVVVFLCTQTQPMQTENNGFFVILLWKVKTIFCSRLF